MVGAGGVGVAVDSSIETTHLHSNLTADGSLRFNGAVNGGGGSVSLNAGTNEISFGAAVDNLSLTIDGSDGAAFTGVVGARARFR